MAATEGTAHASVCGDSGEATGCYDAEEQADASELLSRLPPSPDGDEEAFFPCRSSKTNVHQEEVVEEDEEDYEDVFQMMLEGMPGEEKKEKAPLPGAKRAGLAGCEDGDGEGSGLPWLDPKRPRLHREGPFERLSQDPASSSSAIVHHEGVAQEEERPPDRVLAAYRMLDLPLAATVRDVERRCRQQARAHHPDKVPCGLRLQAARDFRELQEAKACVLAWIEDRRVLAELDSPLGDATSDEEGGLLDPNARCTFGEEEVPEDGYETPSSEGFEEMKAAGAVGKDGRVKEFGESPDESEDEDDPRFTREDKNLVSKGSNIRTEDGVLAQAHSLSCFLPGIHKKRGCTECFEREAEKGSELCRVCRVEANKLRRQLGLPED